MKQYPDGRELALKDRIDYFMGALKNYIISEIAAADDTDPDSMGSYYEENYLEQAIYVLLGKKKGDMK